MAGPGVRDAHGHKDEPATVTLTAGPASLEVALAGATPLHWFVPLVGTTFDLLDGYRDEEELRSQDGTRNGIMAPFCNRVTDARYTFAGFEHDLLPGAEDRTIYHGLVRTAPFTLVSIGTHHDVASAHLRCTALDGRTPGYPFEVLVDVTYRLGPASLDVAITGRNVGRRAAPFAAGWHPYFRLPGAARADDLHLDLGEQVPVRTDARQIPLPGEAAYAAPEVTRWAPVGDAVVDAAFTGPGRGTDPLVTTLTAPRSGTRLTLTQERGLVHVFTGDTIVRGRRESIAVEPVEAMTDAFNRPEWADRLRLAPGHRRVFRIGVAVAEEAVEDEDGTLDDLDDLQASTG